MKKIIAWLLVLSLTAAISIGATLAYLTDTDEDVNVMTLGKVKIDQLEYERVDVESKDDNATVQEFHDNKPLLPAVTDKDFTYIPGDTYVDWDQIGKDGYTSEIWDPSKINNEQDKMVFIKNKGDYDAFVRSVFAFEAGKYATLEEFQKMVHLNLNTTDYTWEWVQTPVAIPNEEGGTTNYFVATATYNKVLAPGALTEISLSQIALDKTATNADVEAFGDTYQILVKTQAIQADGFDNPVMALFEGFGEVDAMNVPWENDSPIKGDTVFNALHYLNADVTSENITAKVENVTFALTKEYASIASGYKGALVDVEQDVPVYAYYVPDGSNYHVYFLADDDIYTPVDSTGLFKDMTALKTVDTANLNVSRTKIMYEMFRNCSALTAMDVSDWDTGNATDMRSVFRNCKALPEIDVADWNTSKVTNMGAMFRECKAVKELDTSKWDVSNVTNFTQTFAICDNLQIVHSSNWNTSKATTFSWMFYECRKLNTLDVSNWDTSNVTDMEYMFDNCKSLEILDVSQWNTGKVTTFDHMFASRNQNAFDMKFKELDVSNWDTSNVVEMNSMFYGCGSLTKLDLSGWDVSKVTTVNHMLSDCNHLTELNLKGWDTSSLVVMDCFLNDCDALTVVDVSTFKTHNVKDFCQVFDSCEALTQIIGLENWDTSNGLIFEEMFAGCPSLKELNLSSFNTRNAMNSYKSEADTYNGFQSMFNGTNALEKLVLSDDFSFDGDGKVTTASYKMALPSPAAKEGYTAMWRNVATGELYLAKDIPEKTAATYEVYYQYTNKGATMKNALHFLNADPKGTQITTKVTSVTFGRTEDYADIANTYTGVLADQEQDGPVYAYYVPNGSSNYDVYFLASGDIYAPANCYELMFDGTTRSAMSSLVSFNAENLNTSRTTSMARMFRDVGATSLDLSGFDTAAVTDMSYMFYNCNKMDTLNVTGWDTRNVKTTQCMFYFDNKLTNIIGEEGWVFSSVETVQSMFRACTALETLDVTNWDMSNAKNLSGFFCANSDNTGAMTLKELVGTENWNIQKVETLRDAFYGCGHLETVNMSNWNVSNLTTMSHMFADCYKLKNVDFTGWNTASLISMNALFNHCTSLKTVDLSMFDTSKVKEFAQLFEACGALENVVGLEKWNTANGHDYSEMFSGCGSLKELNLSAFDTRLADAKFLTDGKYENCMFQRFLDGCSKLEKITFGPNFSFDGMGNCPDGYKLGMPAATGVAGWDGKWYNAETGVGYLPSEIPECTAATYLAVNPNAAPPATETP